MRELLQVRWEQCGGPFQVPEWTKIFDLNLLRIHTQAPVILTSLIRQGWVNRWVAGFSVLARGLSIKDGSLNDTSSVRITGSPQFAGAKFNVYASSHALSTLGIFNAAGFLCQHCPDSRSILLKPFTTHHIRGLRACFKHARRFFTCKEVFGNLSNTLSPSQWHVDLSMCWLSYGQAVCREKSYFLFHSCCWKLGLAPASRQAIPAGYWQH